MSRNLVWIVVQCALVALAPPLVRAQDKPEPADEAPVVKVYRVVDLVLPAPNYPYEGTFLPALRDPGPTRVFSPGGMGGGMGGMNGGMGGGVMGGGMGGGMFQVPDHLAQVAGGSSSRTMATREPVDSGVRAIDMDQLIETIQSTVEPDSWEESGGPGTISPIGGALAVRQTPSIHAKVHEFLEAVKRESGALRILSVDARWLMLDNSQLAGLRGGAEGGKPTSAGEIVDPKALAAIPAEAQRFAGQITCFNGQTVHLVSGRIETVINGLIPVAGTQVGYQPIMYSPHLGVLLQITPSALPENDGVLVDLHSSVTRWEKSDKAARVGTTPNSVVTVDVDRLNVSAQQFATSLRVPLDKPILVGGVTFPSGSDPVQAPTAGGADATAARPGLYLVLKIHSSADK